jgi:hypothetical protein
MTIDTRHDTSTTTTAATDTEDAALSTMSAPASAPRLRDLLPVAAAPSWWTSSPTAMPLNQEKGDVTSAGWGRYVTPSRSDRCRGRRAGQDSTSDATGLGVQVATPGDCHMQPHPGDSAPKTHHGQPGSARRRTLAQWWHSPIHQSPEPLPRWLAEALLSFRPAQTGAGSGTTVGGGPSAAGNASEAPCARPLPRTLSNLVGAPLSAGRRVIATRFDAATRGRGRC